MTKKSEKKSDKVAELTTTVKLIQADFENYKKRIQRDAEETRNRACANLIEKLLPIVDNFELALKSTEVSEGIKLIYAELLSTLEKEGLKPIEALGKKFDPTAHEALLSQEDKGDENIVLEELQKGYELHGRIIRHTKVKISKRGD